MYMVPFYEKFPDLGFKETRSATIRGFRGLPDGEYAFLECYCDEPDCDCRRVFINVISRDMPGKILATINYGWESAEFYIEWMGDDEDIEGLKGPALAPPPALQTKFAPHLLELFKKVALEDPRYVPRLRRHYRMFKQTTKGEHALQSGSETKSSKRSRGSKKRSRKKSKKR